MTRDWGYAANLCPPWNDNMIVRKLVATGLTKKEAINAILASANIADRCNVELPSLPMVRFPLPRGYVSGVDLWRDWLREGWRYRKCNRLPHSELERYKERLKHEMEVIEEKDFTDYFLIVSDAVRWAKDHDIAVGPARGSAAGSLACWLLRITEVNPMLYEDLVFERFIDYTRQDLPDIDLDFDSLRRSEVREYLVAKYGPDRVGQVGTFTKFKAKNSLDDAARVYNVPKWKIEQVKDVLIERSSGDLRASATIEDTVEQFDVAREVFEEYPDLVVATELEGNYKGLGIHSAGLVVSTGDIDEVCAVYERESKGEIVRVISMDKYDAEKKGLLKLDFLGLVNVTMLNNCRLEMGWSLDDLYSLDLEDQACISAFNRNDVVGIFQIEGRACRYVNGALQPDNFYEVCLVNALGRPGPLHNGAANDYIDIKFGRKEPEIIHPELYRICKKTYGQVVYQEQILRILGEIGDFDWTHRAEVRRIISRKIGEQAFNRKWEQFRDGAKKLHGMDEEVAQRIWGLCITAGSYAFNASHSVSYGMISLHSMWFKQHEPELFFQEQLKIRDAEGQRLLLRDAARGWPPIRPKVEIRSPDPQKSGISWTHTPGALQAGFDEIPGVGEKIAREIIKVREQSENGGWRNWDDLQQVRGIGAKTITKMKEFVEDEDPFNAMWLDKAIASVKEDIEAGVLGPLPVPTHTASDLPYSRGQPIEVVWLGTVYTRNVRDLFEWNRSKTGVELKPEEVRDPHLSEWCVMVGDDETDQMGLRVDRWKYPKWRDLIWRMRPGKDLVLIQGVKPGWMPTRQIEISKMWLIDPEM
jgi:DNA polymerase-3 subunit alpha